MLSLKGRSPLSRVYPKWARSRQDMKKSLQCIGVLSFTDYNSGAHVSIQCSLYKQGVQLYTCSTHIPHMLVQPLSVT